MSAPSFSSFPPSFSSFPDLEQQSKATSSQKQSQDHERPREHSKKGKHHKAHRTPDDGSDRHKLGKKKRDQHDDERLKREEDRHARLGATSEGGAPGLFVVDKVGDPMNVVYGGLHAGDVPKYRRVGFGNVLGLGNAFKIVTRGTGGKLLEVGINGRRPPARYTDARSLAILTTIRPRHLLTASHGYKGKTGLDADVESQAEYVRLPSRRGRSIDEPLSTYRSIHTSKGDPNSDSDASSSAPEDADASSSDSDADITVPRSAHQLSLAALEAALQKDPTSLPTWYALLDQTLSTVPPSAKSSLARARAEVKLSVLDRAIRSHERNQASVELRVKWLNTGAEVWDGEKLEREWEHAVTELGGRKYDDQAGKEMKNAMWHEWLRWRISSVGRGSRRGVGVEGIVSDARRVIEHIEGEKAKVKVLWRIAVVLREAGFLERAMAIFQAQAELIFNCASDLVSKPFLTRLDALEEFWDAEYPRMGELDAHGRDGWERKGKPQFRLSGPPSRTPPSSMDVDLVTDPYSRWAADEARLDASSNMPKHGDDAGEDPYATVLFSDVRPLLVDITTPEAKHAFRIAWLQLLGLHVPGFVGSLGGSLTDAGRDDVWSHTHLTREAYLRRLFPPSGKGKEKEWDAFAGTVIAREKTYNPTFGCVKEWGFGVFDPLEGIRIGEGRLWEDVDVSGVDKELIRRIFEQSRRKGTTTTQDEEWDTMAIAFEAASSIKSALKLSRTLLATARDSLPLWGVHARLERMRGKEDEARRIYDAALSTAPGPARRGEAALWWAWAEMEWLTGDDNRARAVVFNAAGLDPSAGGAMTILRAKRGLEDRIRSHHDPGQWRERESWTCLRALLEILVVGGPEAVEEGMRVLERLVSENGLEGVARESAWTRMLLLAWKHTTMLKRQVRRTAVRNKVFHVVREIDRVGGGLSTAILGVFLESEKGESIWGRVRALVGEGGTMAINETGLALRSREKGVVRRVWEVWLANWERGRWEAEMERVRTSLGIGVEEERARASAILWRIYVEFEIYCRELKRAKALLFRAVSECPLVKDLYLLAFGPLRAVFIPRELESWAETMAERGIRMHHGLDEYASTGGERDERGSSSSSSESGGEEELEREARDYRRLAPF